MPRLLLLDDDPLVARAVLRITPEPITWVAVESVDAALASLDEREPFAGALIDVGLKEGPYAGLDLAFSLRERKFRGVLGIFTGALDQRIAEAVARLGAFLLSKGVDDGTSFEDFFRCVLRTSVPPDGVDDAVASVLGELPFTDRERDLVATAARGHDPSELPSILGLSVSTRDTHAKSVLRKTGKRRLQSVAIEMLRRAFERRRGG